MAERVQQDRDRLKTTFDAAAGDYQQARPEYPAQLYASLVAAAGLRPDAELLEIGCATGKATIPLAERGYRITCLEIGPRLAAAARRNLSGYPGVQVLERAFEDWQPPAGQRYDLIFAATAWHWIDPAVGYQLAWRWLRPGGHLAIWEAGHVLPADADPFFREIQDVYDEIGSGLPPGADFPVPGNLPHQRAEIEASGLFGITLMREFCWEVRYTAEGYIRLLDTFSSNLAMAQWQRDRLYGEIRRRLALRPDGTLRRHWGAVLQIAGRHEPGN